ncbi:DUF262 domain-containing protein [Burkholderia sp. AU6039]|uniref:DUF262 domain-containing protein n=1 Tax=Burkholderia sp. AU6039 TaxID=2015344 RepID=UPI000B7A8D5F|nr:DUF262 domain-containing protein [Burkholderia sp. AU6039]OXJ08212.1 hypothetical protein CFB39_37360 [Burkholderia sp. AU6039]
MQPQYIPIGVLFAHGIRHTVPLFQRPYVWDEENQWQPLWEDISGLLDRIERGSGKSAIPGHFLGTVVLEQTPNVTGSLPRREVIDGQQRLTTLQIVLKAAEHAFETILASVEDASKRAVEAAHRQISALTINPGWVEEEEQYKVWPTNEDRAPFVAVMSSSASDDYSAPVTQMARAYAFFRQTFQSYLTESERVPRVQRLAAALKDHLRVIVLDLDNSDEPQAIFETLNAHGTPLLPADLIKNWVLWEANRQNLDASALYEKHWRIFDRDHEYWRKVVGTGHAARPRVDTFLQNWLTKETLTPISTKHLYDKFLQHVESLRVASPDQKVDIPKLMSGIHADALRYLRISDPQGSSRFDEFLRRLRALDVVVFHPLLLALLGRPGITDSNLDEAAIVLESYLVRRMICGYQTRGYGGLVTSLMLSLQVANDGDVVTVLRRDLAVGDGWPSDSEFKREWLNRKFYGMFRRDRVVMILRAIEEAYQHRNSRAEPVLSFNFAKLEIEHIMPQNWVEHWPLKAGESLDERARVIQGIGNLTLVSQKLNGSLSNAPWNKLPGNDVKTKRDALEEHSKLELNRLPLKTYVDWDEKAIAKRAEVLFEEARAIWPL